MERPFRELHELYRILFLRVEAQIKADKEKAEKENKEREQREKAEISRGAKPPQLNRLPPPDAKRVTPDDTIQTPSPLEAEALEEMFEEMAEGGVI